MSDTIDPAAEYAGLLAAVVAAATAAGDRLMADFSPDARPASRADMAAGGRHLEELVLAELRPELARLRPRAGWVDDDLETAPLPPGEWWVVDAVEGAVNYVHGLPEWAVTVTLLRDGRPVLTVVRQPARGRSLASSGRSSASTSSSR
jgi:myo-inositol-1(or 4)-monophosphatase